MPRTKASKKEKPVAAVENGVQEKKGPKGRPGKKVKDIAENTKESVEEIVTKGKAKGRAPRKVKQNDIDQAGTAVESQLPMLETDAENGVTAAAKSKEGRRNKKIKEETTESSVEINSTPNAKTKKHKNLQDGDAHQELASGETPRDASPIIKEEQIEEPSTEIVNTVNEDLAPSTSTSVPGRGKRPKKVQTTDIKEKQIKEPSNENMNGVNESPASSASTAAPKRGGKRSKKVQNPDVKEKQIVEPPNETTNGVNDSPTSSTSTSTSKRGGKRPKKLQIEENNTDDKSTEITNDEEPSTPSTSNSTTEKGGKTKVKNGAVQATKPKGRKRKGMDVVPQRDINIAETDTIKEQKPQVEKKRGRSRKPVAVDLETAEEKSPQKKAKIEMSESQINKNRGKRNEKLDDIKITEDTKMAADEKSKPSPSAKPTSRKRAIAKPDDDEIEENEEEQSEPKKSKKPLINPTETAYNKADFELSVPVDGNLSNVSNNGGEHQRIVLKISSWNVAGLRSWLKKGGLQYVEYEEPDILCMQETKCTIDQLPEEVARIPGYHPYWLCLPGGYAGVALYSKIMPINVEYGIGNEEFDSAGRLITAEYEKFYLINVYVPNSGRKLVNLEARMRWEKLFQAFVKKLDALKPVVICGDMNVSHQEIDLANPKSNTRSAGFTIEEREKMTELLSLGFIDTYRHLYPDKRGAYTYWTYIGGARSRNVGWRLDYFIVSERIIKRVVDNAIRSQCKGSDHCPITLFINI